MNGGDHDEKWDFINRQLKHLESFTLEESPTSSPSGTNVDPPTLLTSNSAAASFLPSSSSSNNNNVAVKSYRKSEGDLPRKESPDFSSLMTSAALPPQSAPVINSAAATNDFFWLNSAGGNIFELSAKPRTNTFSKDVKSNNDNQLSVTYMHSPAKVHERSKSDSASTSGVVPQQLTSAMKSNVSSSSNSPTLYHHHPHHHHHSPNYISSPSSPSLSSHHHHSPLAGVSHNFDSGTELSADHNNKYYVNDKLGNKMFLRTGGTIPRKLSNEMKRKQLSPGNRRKSAPLSDSVQIKSVPRRAFSQKFATSNSPRGTPPPSENHFPGLSKEDSLQKVNEIFSSPELVNMFEDEPPKDEDYTRGKENIRNCETL